MSWGRACLLLTLLPLAAFGVGGWRGQRAAEASRLDSRPPLSDPVLEALGWTRTAGQWRLEGLPFGLATRECGETELPSLLAEPAGGWASPNRVSNPDWNLESVLARCQLVRRDGPRRVYGLDSGDARLRLFMLETASGHPQFSSATFAYPRSADRWTVLFATVSPDDSAPDAPHLLPPPISGRTVARRLSPAGVIDAEIFVVAADHDEVFAGWKSAGWTFAPVAGGSASDGSPSRDTYLGTRGTLARAVTLQRDDASFELCLIVTRLGEG